MDIDDYKKDQKAVLLDILEYKDMSEDEVEEQRISFAYGNVNIHNKNVTKEVVKQAAKELKKGQKKE